MLLDIERIPYMLSNYNCRYWTSAKYWRVWEFVSFVNFKFHPQFHKMHIRWLSPRPSIIPVAYIYNIPTGLFIYLQQHWISVCIFIIHSVSSFNFVFIDRRLLLQKKGVETGFPNDTFDVISSTVLRTQSWYGWSFRNIDVTDDHGV